MDKDMVYKDSLNVEGNILEKDGERYNLTVKGNISAHNISVSDISASDISALNISAHNISASDISASDIFASDISAHNIFASNISALNISYYAVCFAYRSIKCKSIKGSRKNSKHFVLDGEIEEMEW